MTANGALGPHDPGRRLRLVSHAYIRKELREALPGVRVTRGAVEAAVAELESRFAELKRDAVARYEREHAARRVHGVYPRGWLRDDHVAPDDPRETRSTFGGVPGIDKARENTRGNELGQRAEDVVKHEQEDAREVA